MSESLGEWTEVTATARETVLRKMTRARRRRNAEDLMLANIYLLGVELADQVLADLRVSRQPDKQTIHRTLARYLEQKRKNKGIGNR